MKSFPSRTELEKLPLRKLLELYAGVIEDDSILRLKVEDLLPHGHPATRPALIEALARHWRLP